MTATSTSAVLAALVGNSIVAVLKLVAFFFSGSGAMFSEALHTLADVANQALLYVGIRRSTRSPDALFPYGYGGERYFFALLSAVGIFVLGCGVTVYHGVHTLLHPPELTIDVWVFVVLGLSFLLDGYVFLKALAAVRAQMGERSVRRFARSITDPTALAVLFEDFAACLGILIAAVCIGLSHWTGNPVWDSIGSILIGGMMGLIAVWLGFQNRILILGRSIPVETRQAALDYLHSQPSVETVRAVQSRVLGAADYRLKAEVAFDGRQLAQPLAPWVAEQAPTLTDPARCEEFAGEFGEKLIKALGEEVDRMEQELRERHPELRYLDFEAD
ncbi:MAG: cation diffusion facilitator family transporter [Planctomycetota bacterium]|jgi:zinc transporter 9